MDSLMLNFFMTLTSVLSLNYKILLDSDSHLFGVTKERHMHKIFSTQGHVKFNMRRSMYSLKDSSIFFNLKMKKLSTCSLKLLLAVKEEDDSLLSISYTFQLDFSWKQAFILNFKD